jgi:hypothetical protein
MSEKDYVPDPKLHRNISIIKSILRIIAGTALCFGGYFICGVFLVVAELLGIVEELV